MVGVNNLEKSKKFYDAVFGAIGIGPGVANKERYFYMSPGGVFAITKPINGIHKIEFSEFPKVIYIDAAQAEQDNAETMPQRYRITTLKRLE